LPLIVRPDHLEHHAGQIALPGGIIEPGESSWAAAARELHEELGVPPAEIEPLGQLSPLYIFGSNHFVETWVASAVRRPDLTPSADEVAEVLEVPLGHLLDPASHGIENRMARGVWFQSPFYSWHGQRIWGATAMILAELAAIAARLTTAA
jgi:8-oxo-dGTP pyrophosphatase MutT (NUDIX family)